MSASSPGCVTLCSEIQVDVGQYLTGKKKSISCWYIFDAFSQCRLIYCTSLSHSRNKQDNGQSVCRFWPKYRPISYRKAPCELTLLWKEVEERTSEYSFFLSLYVAVCSYEGRTELTHKQQGNFRAHSEGMDQTLGYILLESAATVLIIQKCNKRETGWSIYWTSRTQT